MDSLSATPAMSPRSSLLRSSIIFKSPYHLLQRCLHHSANCPGMRPSRWDCPSTLCLVDICAAYPSHSPVHHRSFDICAAFPSHSPVHHCQVDICAALPSHSPVHHFPVDICAAFPSHSPIHYRQVDICAAFLSHSPLHLCPVDICAAFSSSPPPFHQVNICHGYHHANLRIGA